MNKRTVIISFGIAILLGVFLGVIIGLASGLFDRGNSADSNVEGSAEMVTDKDKLIEEANKKDAELNKAAEEKYKAENNGQDKEKTQSATTDNNTDKTNKTTDKATKTDKKGTPGTIATGNGQSLNVRQSADASSAIIGGVADGSSVTILGRENGMVHVRTSDGVEGWVAEQFVS